MFLQKQRLIQKLSLIRVTEVLEIRVDSDTLWVRLKLMMIQ